MGTRLKRYSQQKSDNKSKKSMLHTEKSKFLKAVLEKDVQKANNLMPKIQSILFKLEKKGIVKFNTARRCMSNFSKQIKIMQ